MMEHKLLFSEVLKIIEAGMERDKKKVIAYSKLLMRMVDEDRAKRISNIISGKYKRMPKLKVKQDGIKRENS